MTMLMIGDSIAVAAILLCCILLCFGSEARDGKDNKIWLFIFISLAFAFLIDRLVEYAPQVMDADKAKKIEPYVMFVVGIFSAMVYTYSFIPAQHDTCQQPNDAYVLSVLGGIVTITLGIACFFLNIEFPKALHIGALEPIAALSTSLGASMTAAAAVEDTKRNPEIPRIKSIKRFVVEPYRLLRSFL